MSVGETTLMVPISRTWAPRRLLADERLVRLATRGDRRAFEAMFERYQQELYRYCRAILRDPDDAQDALQSTMASALHSLPGEERRIILRPWLYRVAHNEAISIFRKRSELPDAQPALEATTAGADSEVEARERMRVLVADLERLPERQRGALVMRELSGLSYAEIGTALSASPAAARQAVYEARVALREASRGREMECETARRAVSEGDGRSLRNRRLRAHLRDCESCSDFQAAISQRSADLKALCPPLPALVASSVLTAVLGGTGKGGLGAAAGGVASGTGGVASGITGGMVAKGASLAAAIAIGAGAAGMSGVVRIPVLDRNDSAVESSSKPATTPGVHHAGLGQAGAVGSAGSSSRIRGGSSDRGARQRGANARHAQARPDGAGGADAPADHAQANGLPASSHGTPPAHSSAGGNSNGNGHAGGGAPGNSEAAPGHSGSSPGNSAAAPGHSGSTPGNSAAAPGHSGSTPGNSAAAPGHGGSTSGNSAAAPGHGGSGSGRGAATVRGAASRAQPK
ncbi:MAG: sigma-70 family RNA polymerase sigma factor [Solirubrobacterales bacterium]